MWLRLKDLPNPRSIVDIVYVLNLSVIIRILSAENVHVTYQLQSFIFLTVLAIIPLLLSDICFFCIVLARFLQVWWICGDQMLLLHKSLKRLSQTL